MQLKVPMSFSPQVHSGVPLGMVTEVCWQGLLKNVPKRLCATAFTFQQSLCTCMDKGASSLLIAGLGR